VLLSEINPYVRFARYIDLDGDSYYAQVTPLDARVFYALDGCGKIQVEDKTYEMRPYSLLIINSGVPYKLHTPQAAVQYIGINFDYTRNAASRTVPVRPVSSDRFAADMLVDFNTFEDAPVLDRVLYIGRIEAISRRLTAVVGEHMQKLLYFEQKTGHLLAECIAESMRFWETGSSHPEQEKSARILSYIHDHYPRHLTNDTLGKVFGYHPNYVSFLIKRTTGMPVHRYVLHVRLMNAANLLENTSASIGEIALSCGFCDAAYFSGYFKKYFGISPSQYRNA